MFNGQPEILARHSPVPRPFPGYPYDSFEQYAVSDDVNLLNKGVNWNLQPWKAQFNFLHVVIYEDFESYSVGAEVDGLNAGVAWPAAWAAQKAYRWVRDYDDAESYTPGASVNGLSGGVGDWISSPYVAN